MSKMISILLIVYVLGVSGKISCPRGWTSCEDIEKKASLCDLVQVKDLVSTGYHHTFLYASSGWFVEVNTKNKADVKNNIGFKRRGIIKESYNDKCCRINNFKDHNRKVEKRTEADCVARFRRCIEDDNIVGVCYNVINKNCEHYASSWRYKDDNGFSDTVGFWQAFGLSLIGFKNKPCSLPKNC